MATQIRRRGTVRGYVTKETEKLNPLLRDPGQHRQAIVKSTEKLAGYRQRLRIFDEAIQGSISDDADLEVEIQESEQWEETLAEALSQANAAIDSRSSADTVTTAATSLQQMPAGLKQPEPNRPPLLESSVSLEDFEGWCAIWKDYALCYRFDALPPEQQLARFRTFLSPDMRHELVHGVGIADCEQIELSVVLQRIQLYIRSRRNVALDRVAFAERSQQEGEAFDDFFIALKKIAKNADLCEHCYETQLSTRIMVGVRDKQTRQKLLALRPFPELKDVADICRGEECAKANDELLCSGKANVNKVQSARKPQSSQHRGDKRQEGSQGYRNSGQCYWCGNKWHGSRAKCPAREEKCKKCGTKGHFAKVCSKKHNAADATQLKKVTRIELRIAATSRKVDNRAPVVKVDCYPANSLQFLGTVTATPDSAAEGTVAGLSVIESLGLTRKCLLRPDNVELIAANGDPITCVGVINVTFKLSGNTATERVYVCKQRDDMLLSWMLAKKLHILPSNYPAVQINTVNKSDKKTSQNQLSDRPHTTLTDAEAFVKMLGEVPENPTGEQRERIHKMIVEHYSDVFEVGEHLKKMDCPPLVIRLREGARPFSIRVPRPIPVPWQAKVKSELDSMVGQDVVAKVSDSEATEWCHPIVVVAKKDGTPRICVDLTKLNPHVVRPLHPMQTPKQAVSDIPNEAKFFSVFDARKGYWQMELAEESQHPTTFMTPWGRYKFLRAPMGLNATGDEYCYQGDKALLDLGNIRKVVDDCLTFDATFRDHVRRVCRVLDRCREKHITLNPKKFLFGESKVEFCGYVVSGDGIQADPKKIRAIVDFPTPTNITELRLFFGLFNQLTHFTHDVSRAAEPLRPLLSAKNQFRWTGDHDAAFSAVKQALSKPPLLAHFDMQLETALLTDAARSHGLGFALMQKHGENWRLVECGSRFLIPAETRYSTTELEMLAVVWATRKLRVYLQGLAEYQLVTNHKSLVPILNEYTLEQIENPRLQRLKEKLAGYAFRAVWKRGKDHSIPDALSRGPVDLPNEDDQLLQAQLCSVIVAVKSVTAIELHGECSSDPNLDFLYTAAKKSPEYQQLLNAVTTSVNFEKATGYVGQFKKIASDLSVSEGLVMYGARIVVPKTAARVVLEKLHSAHQGITRTKRRARQCFYWPSMSSDIENLVKGCSRCEENQASLPKEPIASDPFPSWVFQEVGVDLFSYGGNHFMVYVDRLSGWPVMYAFGKHDPNARQVIRAIRAMFSDLGVPIKLRSDNGPQFASRDFQAFLSRWGVKHAPSTPHFPQSNGLAEAAVKSMKAIVRKVVKNGNLNDDAYTEAILEYRNTPRSCGVSPAELVFGHSLRSHIPAHRTTFAPQWQENMKKAERKALEQRAKSDAYYNESAHPLANLKIGQKVSVQDPSSKKWDQVGEVVGIGKRRDYVVKLASGRYFWRNRRFLRPSQTQEITSETTDTETEQGAALTVPNQQPLRRSARNRKPPDRLKSNG